MERHGGTFPTSYADILALPGVGPYTAGAIASTAYNEEVPCVDGNVERVLSRVFDIDTPVKEEPAKSRIRELAQALIPRGEARNFNQGLMELGALVCRKKPECERCPLAGLCESRHLGIQNERPVPGKKAAVTQIEVVCGVLLHEGKIFIQRRRRSSRTDLIGDSQSVSAAGFVMTSAKTIFIPAKSGRCRETPISEVSGYLFSKAAV